MLGSPHRGRSGIVQRLRQGRFRWRVALAGQEIAQPHGGRDLGAHQGARHRRLHHCRFGRVQPVALQCSGLCDVAELQEMAPSLHEGLHCCALRLARLSHPCGHALLRCHDCLPGIHDGQHVGNHILAPVFGRQYCRALRAPRRCARALGPYALAAAECGSGGDRGEVAPDEWPCTDRLEGGDVSDHFRYLTACKRDHGVLARDRCSLHLLVCRRRDP
mmetsp:Transcript_52806/g.113073  ORF Transcript_52806/g.113073 Transcript_52806/m.113073 type:complete len:218 (+) Transcript_52806:413-1066(+)